MMLMFNSSMNLLKLKCYFLLGFFINKVTTTSCSCFISFSKLIQNLISITSLIPDADLYSLPYFFFKVHSFGASISG